MHEKIAYVIKHYAVIQFLYRIIMSVIFRILGLFVGNDDKLVLLSSMSGDQYSDSPKIIFEKMKEDVRFKDFHYVWAFVHPEKFDIEGAEKVKMDSLAYFTCALRAKIWITNVNIERGLHFKKKRTIYLNTWHGTGPKKGGNAIKGRKDYDFSYVDIVCVDGKYARDEMVNWFNAKDENLLWCGRPREDELLALKENDKLIIREELNIPQDKKILLYMPTWREYGNLELNCQLWERHLGAEYVLLVRSHHFAKNDFIKATENPFWVDVSNYESVNKLYYIADILISDYSSAFFDYGLLGKPMICFAYDYEKYEADNGLFMDLKNEFPSGVKRTEQDVINSVLTMQYEEECTKCKTYCDSYVSHPGNATNACIDKIYEKLIEK